jgi:hypothetical protein
MKKRCAWFSLLAVTSLSLCRADENEWFVPLGPPPVASPKRISGGEGVPPLPLPATPLRRSERKREPTAPKPIGKVVWGESASFQYSTGEKCDIADWNLCPGDLQQVMRKASGQLGVPYGGEVVNLGTFHGDPGRTPVLLLSGVRRLRLNASQVGQMRDFVQRGGMVVVDSVAGSPYFYESAKKLFEESFGDVVWRVIPADHPLYHMVYDVQEVRYPKNLASKEPFLEGLYVGSRVGVLVSKYGLGCGWDDREVPLLDKAVYYDVASATMLGVNIAAYAIGYAEAGREEAKPEIFGALDEKAPTDEFVFAQVKHEGQWNTHPGAAAALLRRLRQSTALRTSLKRAPVVLGKDDLAGYSFLFLSGLDEFRLDEAGVEALRGFLAGNGTLVINNGLGLKTFDRAVRRELKKVLPEAELAPLPVTHPVYSSVFTIREAQYTPAVTQTGKAPVGPYLEGISLGGDVRVMYSPYDLEGGWLGCEYPLSKGFEPNSAMQLGLNVVLYAATH